MSQDVGHVEFLKKCRDLGTYIIIGLYSDESASFESGRIGPILTLQERLLSLLACRYVNNIIMDPPYNITDAMLDFFKVRFPASSVSHSMAFLTFTWPYKFTLELLH
ncbi:unnamed protein product [Dibothriocephalus latus]|uniref:ethanolamine-phosphate cytidylyltransferase n=1 Tax=Dibothriocephalus latus TaxID=60516 RepID=A0A3P7LYM4_DIBLA|nr:unnamed protein product [Dibothriocephalus latus]